MSIHPQILSDTHPVCLTPNAHVLMMNDSRWPWLILVPLTEGINELHDLTHEQRNSFMADVNQVSRVIQHIYKCKSINVAMLGNVVAQLHCHVVAREESDAAWPRPVWGFEKAVPYGDDKPEALLDAIRKSFS